MTGVLKEGTVRRTHQEITSDSDGHADDSVHEEQPLVARNTMHTVESFVNGRLEESREHRSNGGSS